MLKNRAFGIVSGMTVATTLLSGCMEQASFSPSNSSKSEVLSTTSVFNAPTTSQDTQGSYPGPSPTPSSGAPGAYPTSSPSPGSGAYPTASPSPSGGVGSYPTGLPVETYCSAWPQFVGTDLMIAKSLTLNVLDPNTNKSLCSVTTGIRDTILSSKLIDFSGCASVMTKNSYTITIKDPNAIIMQDQDTFSPGNLLFYPGDPDGNNHDSIGISRSATGSNWVVTHDNERTGPASSYALISSDGNCQTSGDPLIIDTAQSAQKTRPIDLGSQAMGILFDILGLNSTPVAHAPKRISWLRNHDYMFLVLPDSSGNVTGADQMFGNNNLGPDGKFAANGFAALAKYDSNGDGIINQKDSIFSQLRLWSDANFDGVSQPGELFTLDQMGISEIDLGYDAHFAEKDAYGNEVKYKSVVKYSDGSMHLIFDLWFAIKN